MVPVEQPRSKIGHRSVYIADSGRDWQQRLSNQRAGRSNTHLHTPLLILCNSHGTSGVRRKEIEKN
jgi:predicted restriction endonuclease